MRTALSFSGDHQRFSGKASDGKVKMANFFPTHAPWFISLALSGLSSPDLNQPDKNPSKFCGGQDVAGVYAEASKAVSSDSSGHPGLPL